MKRCRPCNLPQKIGSANLSSDTSLDCAGAELQTDRQCFVQGPYSDRYGQFSSLMWPHAYRQFPLELALMEIFGFSELYCSATCLSSCGGFLSSVQCLCVEILIGQSLRHRVAGAIGALSAWTGTTGTSCSPFSQWSLHYAKDG